MEPQVAPSSKLYSIANPATLGGGVTVKLPQPALTVGAPGAVGKITTFTVLLGPHVEVPAAPAVVPPHVAVVT